MHLVRRFAPILGTWAFGDNFLTMISYRNFVIFQYNFRVKKFSNFYYVFPMKVLKILTTIFLKNLRKILAFFSNGNFWNFNMIFLWKIKKIWKILLCFSNKNYENFTMFFQWKFWNFYYDFPMKILTMIFQKFFCIFEFLIMIFQWNYKKFYYVFPIKI